MQVIQTSSSTYCNVVILDARISLLAKIIVFPSPLLFEPAIILLWREYRPIAVSNCFIIHDDVYIMIIFCIGV